MTDDALATVDRRRLEDARRILRVLTAAYPSYPFGDDSVELYLAVIVKEMPDFAIAMRAVTDWATSQLYFPKPVELTDAYLAETERQTRHTANVQRAQQHPREGTHACPRCEDTLVEHVKFVVLDHLYEGVVPCSVCRPDDREYQKQGHLVAAHDIFRCAHPRCEERAGARSKRRGGGHRE